MSLSFKHNLEVTLSEKSKEQIALLLISPSPNGVEMGYKNSL